MRALLCRLWLAAAILGPAILMPAQARAVECWRGWAYRVDPDTAAYKSQELLIVTRGATEWRAGVPVALHQLDRASGAIDAGVPVLTVVPYEARTRYQGGSNYVDGRGAIAGSRDDLVFGLNHIPELTSTLQGLQDYTRWACGLAEPG